ncbi:GNAT family N-acetyltransferase [Elizabethkingia anophelis]|uniref:GNAT family acetyltransferase n=1 Tax=Elizabethkingia anophelis TaxID=1117645 RepID=A0A1T3E2Z6_9FLAO|nr:GNAT family N-acetyltransferase [Elizabethkingia anophelis]AQW98708.1 GNAT family acetyltransferase [Elizabethkingia anophelis]AQX50972.1 GNAT family acetyltransferase [Elizabethkingia anophelis]AQX89258.1 GNAT family acetyltransferase [Elizabethkingia anophelis]ASV78586.1 N-acetyltransferase [Elizabethkingia anophelis]EHM7981207.1 GNAT family N-acetyltransferase [Elizabethkingia anophelis]
MTEIVPYNDEHYEALTSYILDETQSQFSLVPREILDNSEIMENKRRFQYTILHESNVAGFFSLDFSSDLLTYSDNENAVLLRALSINPKFQGKGIAKSAMIMLPDFVKKHFPEVEKIVFGVNATNENAYKLYLKTGYLDSGKIYEGVKGPQHIMLMKL